MDRTLPPAHIRAKAYGHHGVSLSFAAALIDLLQTWSGRARTRASLRDLPEVYHDDLGFTERQIEHEASLPFWRE